MSKRIYTEAADRAWKEGHEEGFTGKPRKHLVPPHLHAEFEKGKAQGQKDADRLFGGKPSGGAR